MTVPHKNETTELNLYLHFNNRAKSVFVVQFVSYPILYLVCVNFL